MLEQNNKAMCSIVPQTVATSATAKMSFSRVGNNGETFDFANVVVSCGTNATTSAVYSTLKFVESDTVTSVSSMSAITDLTGGTATSTSVGFVLPTDDLENGGNIEFRIDLRKRKKYVGLAITPGQSLVLAANAHLHSPSKSIDSADDAALTNNESSSVDAMAKIVAA